MPAGPLGCGTHREALGGVVGSLQPLAVLLAGGLVPRAILGVVPGSPASRTKAHARSDERRVRGRAHRTRACRDRCRTDGWFRPQSRTPYTGCAGGCGPGFHLLGLRSSLGWKPDL
jgi:hypothetical protein